MTTDFYSLSLHEALKIYFLAQYAALDESDAISCSIYMRGVDIQLPVGIRSLQVELFNFSRFRWCEKRGKITFLHNTLLWTKAMLFPVQSTCVEWTSSFLLEFFY